MKIDKLFFRGQVFSIYNSNLDIHCQKSCLTICIRRINDYPPVARSMQIVTVTYA